MITCRFLFVVLLFTSNTLAAQTTVKCVEKWKKGADPDNPIFIRSCTIKKYKFKAIGYPDNLGRYTHYEYKVYKREHNKWIKTVNSAVFNKLQTQLLTLINAKIHKEFLEFTADSSNKYCFIEMKSVPVYKMNELGIKFEGNEIWFSVEWDLPYNCIPVSGSIAIFKLHEIEKYLK